MKKRPPFIDLDGRIILPSLIKESDEQEMVIKRDHSFQSLSMDASIQFRKGYGIGDEYLETYKKLDEKEKSLLEFIGTFGSIQKIHAIRQALLFPEAYGNSSSKNITKIVNRLRRFGLIDRWKYYHPIQQSMIDIFTLSGNGYQFIEYIFGNNRNLFHPNLFFKFKEKTHLRFWQNVDVYQSMVALPAYRDFIPYYNGTKTFNIPKTSCSFCLMMGLDNPVNFLSYNNLLSDGIDYLDRVLNAWTKFGIENTYTKIDGLSGNTNLLTLYVPTIEKAEQIAKQLELRNVAFNLIFLIGGEMATNGIGNAFYSIKENANYNEDQLIRTDTNRLMEYQDDNLINTSDQTTIDFSSPIELDFEGDDWIQ